MKSLCVLCLFSALSCRVGTLQFLQTLQMSVIINEQTSLKNHEKGTNTGVIGGGEELYQTGSKCCITQNKSNYHFKDLTLWLLLVHSTQCLTQLLQNLTLLLLCHQKSHLAAPVSVTKNLTLLLLLVSPKISPCCSC